MTSMLKPMIRNAILTTLAVICIPVVIYLIGMTSPQLTHQDSFHATVLEVYNRIDCEPTSCLQARLRTPNGEEFELTQLPLDIRKDHRIPIIADYFDDDHIEYRFDAQHWQLVRK